MSTLEFYLKAKNGGCDLSDTGSFTTALAESLRLVYRSSTNTSTGAVPRFEIVDVRTGSLRGLILATGLGVLAITNLTTTLSAIRDRRELPIRLTGDEVRALKKLAAPLNSNTSKITVGEIPIDEEFVAGCDLILLNSPRSHGQAIGRLEGINTHDQYFFRIYPTGTNRGAQCFFDNSFYKDVYANMRKKVRVEGLIHRDPDGIGIDRITSVSLIEPLPEDSELPKMASLVGLFKNNPINLHNGWESEIE